MGKKQYPTVMNTLSNCLDNILFYDKDVYSSVSKKATSMEDTKNIDDILKSLPVITADDIFYSKGNQFIPINQDRGYTVFQTSGTTGKPKMIYYTEDSLRDIYTAFIMCLKKNGIRKGDIVINPLPAEPALSGSIVKGAAMAMNGINLPVVPGQSIVPTLKIACELSGKEKGILMTASPSILFRSFYNMSDEERSSFLGILNDFKVSILVGGENLGIERAKIINEMMPFKTLINFYGTTEGLFSGGISRSNEGMVLSGYNNHFLLMDENDGKLYGSEDMEGRTGNLIITTKTRQGVKYGIVFVNYRIDDRFKVTDFLANGDVRVDLLGRTDDIKHLGVAKITETTLDNIMMKIGNSYGTGEWQAKITQEGGLDKLSIDVEGGRFKDSNDKLRDILIKELSDTLPEFSYVLSNNLISLELRTVDRDGIKFYKDSYKTKRLTDSRSN